MNVYNEAHNLAQAIKECEEFKTYDALKKKIDESPELAKAVSDFQMMQMQTQISQISGEEISQDVMSKLQELYGILLRDPVAAEYMQAEMRFSLMMNDVYKILGDAIGQTMPGMSVTE